MARGTLCAVRYYTFRSVQLEKLMAFVFLFQAEEGIRYHCVIGVQTCFFFFQAEDGIRDHCVTGVQTCALPICVPTACSAPFLGRAAEYRDNETGPAVGWPAAARGHCAREIGRASCRERV